MILVTGATGMTGRFVVQELQRRHVTSRVLVREESKAKMADLDGEIVIGDLSDFASLYAAMDGVSGIVHVACTFTDALVDVAAMGALLDNWRDGPFIFVSSLDVYGYTMQNPITEEHPLSEDYGDYGRGKVLCERLLSAKAQVEGRTDYAALRAPHIWGPHPKAYRRLVTERVRTGEPVELPGADAAEWSRYQDAWIDVRDLAWVVAECLEHPPGGSLNVLGGHFTWHDLYAEIIRLTGSTSPIVHTPLAEMTDAQRDAQRVYAQTWHFSNERLRQHTGFAPQHTLAETLAEVVAQSGLNK